MLNFADLAKNFNLFKTPEKDVNTQKCRSEIDVLSYILFIYLFIYLFII